MQAAVAALAPLGAAAMAVCGVMMVLDGVSVGAGNLGHLPLNAVAGLAATLGALRAGGGGLSSVWWALLAFYATRTAGHALFYALTWRRGVFAGGGRAAAAPA